MLESLKWRPKSLHCIHNCRIFSLQFSLFMHPSALSLSHSPSINTEYIWMNGAIKSLGHTCKWICVWCVTFMCKWAHCFSSHYFVRFVSADDPIRPNKCNLSNFHHIYLYSIHFNEFHSSGWENVKGYKNVSQRRECQKRMFGGILFYEARFKWFSILSFSFSVAHCHVKQNYPYSLTYWLQRSFKWIGIIEWLYFRT